MKKGLIWLIALLAIGGITWGCVVWYNSSINQKNPNQNNDVVKKDEPIFTTANYPRVDASLALHPLVDSLAANFLGVDKSALNYEYTKTRTSHVYKNLIDGNADVVFVAEAAEEDLQYAKEKGVELEIVPAIGSGFVFIVNIENPVNALTLEQIQKIYTGEIRNWSEVGGEDEEIIPFQRPNGSGSQTAMLSLVMKGKKMAEAPIMRIEQEMGEIIDAVAEYNNAKNAIGYSYYYYVDTMYKRDTVKMISVDGVIPTKETIKSGEYPLTTNGFIALRKDEPEDSSARKWLNAVLSKRGSKVMEDEGYVSIN